MDRYLAQLLEDIEASIAAVPVFQRQGDFDAEEDYVEEEDALMYRRRALLEEIIGIEQIQFPPADRLTEIQIAPILYALERCLDTYGYRPEFPAYLQPRYYYTLLRAQLNRSVPLLMGEVFPLYLCPPSEETSCLLGDSCQCKDAEIWDLDATDYDDLPNPLLFPRDLSNRPFYTDPDKDEEDDDWEDGAYF